MTDPPFRGGRGRLLIATEMDLRGASTRYRAAQHLSRLKQHFDQVMVSLPHDEVPRHPGRIGQARYFGTHAARYANRQRHISLALRSADTVLVQRGLYPLGPGFVAQTLEKFTGRVVFDLDDAVFATKPALAARGPLTRWLYGPQQANRILQRANAVVVSSEELANAIPSWAPRPVVLPTILDPGAYRAVQHHNHRPVIVGWAGTVGNLGYLDPLREVFEQLARTGTAQLEVVSSEPWTGPAKFHRWALSEEASLFQRFSIGVMPLPDTPYTRAKAGFKLLQYMATGLPVVASPIGVNRELVERSGAGFLASSAAEWASALSELANDPGLRAEMGKRGRSFVESYADLDAQAQTLAALLTG